MPSRRQSILCVESHVTNGRLGERVSQSVQGCPRIGCQGPQVVGASQLRTHRPCRGWVIAPPTKRRSDVKDRDALILVLDSASPTMTRFGSSQATLRRSGRCIDRLAGSPPTQNVRVGWIAGSPEAEHADGLRGGCAGRAPHTGRFCRAIRWVCPAGLLHRLARTALPLAGRRNLVGALQGSSSHPVTTPLLISGDAAPGAKVPATAPADAVRATGRAQGISPCAHG